MTWHNTGSHLIPFPVAGTVLTSTRGHYIVGDRIGDGQYGSVYECIGPFDQHYALKMLRPANKPYDTVKGEWSIEMKRLESFRHPNIVYIHDAFEFNSLFYFALERCDTSLKAILGTPFREGLFLELTRQLLMTLQYLHDNGVVHSDLHAGNILLSQLQTNPIVKLTDFGVAQLVDRHAPWFRPQVANPKILAPELITLGYSSTQSDLYQLGLIMYHMYTGHSAFDQDAPAHEMVRSIASGIPRQMAETIGTPVGSIISKLLRRRDAYRYSSARDVWNDLRLTRST